MFLYINIVQNTVQYLEIYRNISDGNLFRSWELRSVIYTVFKQIKRKASTTTVRIKLEEMYNCFLLRQPYETRHHSEM